MQVLTKTNILKKFLYLFKISVIVITWYLYAQSSETYTRWIVFYNNGNEIHKCKQEDYLEVKEMIFTMDSIAEIRFNGLSHKEIEYNSILKVRSESYHRIKEIINENLQDE